MPRSHDVEVLELAGPGALRRSTRPVPPDGPLVALEVTGVCGTDRHVWAGRLPVPTPRILGHELVGRLARGGDGLVGDDVRVGDRVLVAPGVPCRSCAACRSTGRFCPRRVVYGFDAAPGELTGGFAPLLALLPGTALHRVPVDLDAGRAVFAELVACAASGFVKAFGDGLVPTRADVAVLGFGPIGLSAAVVAAWRGAAVVVVEPDAERRAFAADLGFATDTGPGPGTHDVVVECAGRPEAFATGLELLRPGGTLIELGAFADLGPVPVAPALVCHRDLRVVGSGETLDSAFPLALEVVAATPVDLAAAVTHVHRFVDLDEPATLFTTPGTFKAALAFDREVA